MFFSRNQRIKTEPRIPGEADEELRDNKRRLKIKNIRFSFDHEVHKVTNKSKSGQVGEEKEEEGERGSQFGQKRISFTEKLPEIAVESRGGEEVGRELRQVSVQHRKKDMLLSSILEILKPTNLSNLNGRPPEKPFAAKVYREWQIDTGSKEYVNEFIEELPHFNSTKHYRAPKVLESEILKPKNNPNVVRRKIFSQDKERERIEKAGENEKAGHYDKKPEGDLEKIEIITFSSKFPGLKKDSIHLKLGPTE